MRGTHASHRIGATSSASRCLRRRDAGSAQRVERLEIRERWPRKPGAGRTEAAPPRRGGVYDAGDQKGHRHHPARVRESVSWPGKRGAPRRPLAEWALPAISSGDRSRIHEVPAQSSDEFCRCASERFLPLNQGNFHEGRLRVSCQLHARVQNRVRRLPSRCAIHRHTRTRVAARD